MEIDRTIKILLVEDSKMTRKLELKVLNELGFKNVVEADDGNAAAARLAEHGDIRLIISDWNMPGKDGFELLKWVRASDESRKINNTAKILLNASRLFSDSETELIRKVA